MLSSPPFPPTLPQTTQIRQVQKEARGVRTFVLDVALAQAEPGQFIMLWLPGVDEKPMSIACPTPLTVTVARVGPFSTALHARKVEEYVGWRGPYGRGFRLMEGHHALLVSGGCGVGPLYFLATRAIARGIPLTVALGARSADDLLYVERFRALGIEPLIATEDGSVGYAGYVTELVERIADRESPIATLESPIAIYACGPEGMLAAVARLSRERGWAGQLSLERYMKCGFGICGQCALDGFLVCQDGPVFGLEELEGVRDFGRARRSATGRKLPLRVRR